MKQYKSPKKPAQIVFVVSTNGNPGSLIQEIDPWKARGSGVTNVISGGKSSRRSLLSAIGMVAVISITLTARTQPLPPDVAASLKNVVGSRIEAAVILAGDQGFSGGSFSQVQGGTDRRSVDAKVTKFGGAGDIGDPKPLDDTFLRWQPRLQGSMGYLTANNDFHAGSLQGDESDDKSFAIQFGGGARFWFNNHISLAPTIMGMYGHTENDYTARSTFSKTHLPELRDLGLVDWTADTWSVIPGLDLQYIFTWHRTVFTFSSDFTYYYTESFKTSNPNLSIRGSSETWRNMLDVDIPLGVKLVDHELHTGGFFSRTDFYGDLNTGLNTEYMYQIHGRLVLDFLGRLWKVKWIGVGGSYLWGSNFNAWTVGADLAFKF
jgi:hypothetical protein